jgi:hypothetical protein
MAVKRAVFEVDVKGSEKLTAVYQKMQAIKEASAKSTEAKGLTSGAKTVIVMMNDANKVADGVEKKSRTIAGFWRETAISTGKVAGSLYSGLNTLLRWSGIGGLAAGLATGGSIWGLERFASAANYGRRSSTGLGLPYGKQSAFGLAYQRLIDSQGFLGGISTARGNIGSGAAQGLYALGMDPQAKGDTGDVANEALKRIRDLAKNTPEGELGFLLQSHKLGEFGVDTEQLRRLKFGSDDEFSEFQKSYGVRSKQMDVQDSVLKRWQDLDIQLDATAQKLKNSFLTSLEKLTIPLTNLSEAFGNAVASLSGSKGFQEIIDKVAKGMGVFADYIGSQKFQDDVRLFAESIEMLASKTVSALRWLGLIPDPNAPVKDMDFKESNKKVIDTQNKLLDWLQRMNPFAAAKPNYSSFYGQALNTQLAGSNLDPDQLLRLVGQIESGNNPNAIRGKAGEYGQYQIMPATGAQYGFSESLLDTKSGNKQAAQAILADLAKRYNNNLQDILVGYNGGPGAADAWIKNGRDPSKLSPGLQNYLAKAGQAMILLKIENNTGGNATVGISQLNIPGYPQ